jgi:hypothetical protein
MTKDKTLQPKRTIEYLRHDFSQEELLEKAQELAGLTREKGSTEDEKKSANSNFKAQIDKIDAQIRIVSNEISNGYRHQNVDCEIHFNFPNSGMKTIFRKDTGETVKVESMSADEMQLELELQTPKESNTAANIAVEEEAE